MQHQLLTAKVFVFVKYFLKIFLASKKHRTLLHHILFNNICNTMPIPSPTQSATFINYLQQENISFVDIRFIDLSGTTHHITKPAHNFNEKNIQQGIPFDGSSIEHWRDVSNSDMLIMLDLNSTFIDPFFTAKTVGLFGFIYEPSSHQMYTRDPRSIAYKAQQILSQQNFADTAYFGPELEFFLFDHVQFQSTPYSQSYVINSEEFCSNDNQNQSNLAHRPRAKGGYLQLSPIDKSHDIRVKMVENLAAVGLTTEAFHHEVAPAQCELGFQYDTLLHAADNAQKYKYIVKNTALQFGKTATFMPKPIFADNGSGMHVNQSLWHKGENTFIGDKYANLSENALYYIGGIIKHAKALNAICNPTTNSYKRLIPGYEAPVMLAYSACNRSASIRIPYATSDATKRIEVRFADPAANAHLTFAAMLMAGIDGIKNKIHPGNAMDVNLYNLTAAEKNEIPQVCHSLYDAALNLDKDREFLTINNCFTNDLIDIIVKDRIEKHLQVSAIPHPKEFDLYYSC